MAAWSQWGREREREFLLVHAAHTLMRYQKSKSDCQFVADVSLSYQPTSNPSIQVISIYLIRLEDIAFVHPELHQRIKIEQAKADPNGTPAKASPGIVYTQVITIFQCAKYPSLLKLNVVLLEESSCIVTNVAELIQQVNTKK